MGVEIVLIVALSFALLLAFGWVIHVTIKRSRMTSDGNTTPA
jgi:hypothetical protein